VFIDDPVCRLFSEQKGHYTPKREDDVIVLVVTDGCLRQLNWLRKLTLIF